ncbi:ninja-family protein AFP2-like [Tripterygium wilfordii]|uniref:Ninja-family protein n=1 Tax=Tripterygium wilfordii TaxID=458696 RepID=A0A7J7E0D8_TRIWF|nr:ninja-family protein AFP2-like [Tripterygium wilfordii]KAF5752047.1 ninja-family protein AFP2-like [Tripterygium wilfordii]
MSEGNEKRSRSREMESLSLELERYPRDLLQRFTSCDSQKSLSRASEQDTEEIELNLGLSLGGRFGVDKSANKLTRSSSIAGKIPLIREDDALTSPPPVQYPSLMRTSSFPSTETEKEWRNRKEMQTLRRLEAKKRRSEKEKQRNSANSRPEVNTEEERRELSMSRSRSGLRVQLPFGMSSQAAAARQLVLRGAVDAGVKGKGGFFQGQGQPGSQGSAESHGGSSWGLSEFESKAPLQGSSSCGEARNTGSNHSLQEMSSPEVLGSSGTKKNENLCRTSSTDVGKLSTKPDSVENRGKEIGTNPMEDMPCVFTIGDGPNGRKIEGFLYRYGKGEDVRIMCVCHGEFHSPAEFVKHAGGSDVDHPLRHIVVNPSGSPFT